MRIAVVAHEEQTARTKLQPVLTQCVDAELHGQCCCSRNGCKQHQL